MSCENILYHTYREWVIALWKHPCGISFLTDGNCESGYSFHCQSCQCDFILDADASALIHEQASPHVLDGLAQKHMLAIPPVPKSYYMYGNTQYNSGLQGVFHPWVDALMYDSLFNNSVLDGVLRL